MLLLLLPLLLSDARAEEAPAGDDHGHGAPAVTFTLGPTHGAVHAALGARWWAWVGEEADLLALDPAANPHVALAQSAVELVLETPIDGGGLLSADALVRIEEGVAHAGGLEAAEAWAGLSLLDGVLSARLGRDDLPVTRDRALEPEDQPFAVRPVISRAFLPVHVDGLTVGAGLPGHLAAEGGLAWASRQSRSPYRWARLDWHTLAWSGLPVDLRLSGTALSQVSELQGETRLVGGEAGLSWASLRVEGAGRVLSRDDQDDVVSALAELGVAPTLGVLGAPDDAVALDLRGERLTGLSTGEDARLAGTARLAWHHLDGPDLQVYIELHLSREPGDQVLDDPELLVADASLERANDALALGILHRW